MRALENVLVTKTIQLLFVMREQSVHLESTPSWHMGQHVRWSSKMPGKGKSVANCGGVSFLALAQQLGWYDNKQNAHLLGTGSERSHHWQHRPGSEPRCCCHNDRIRKAAGGTETRRSCVSLSIRTPQVGRTTCGCLPRKSVQGRKAVVEYTKRFMPSIRTCCALASVGFNGPPCASFFAKLTNSPMACSPPAEMSR